MHTCRWYHDFGKSKKLKRKGNEITIKTRKLEGKKVNAQYAVSKQDGCL